jgi:hypothetical protein
MEVRCLAKMPSGAKRLWFVELSGSLESDFWQRKWAVWVTGPTRAMLRGPQKFGGHISASVRFQL